MIRTVIGLFASIFSIIQFVIFVASSNVLLPVPTGEGALYATLGLVTAVIGSLVGFACVPKHNRAEQVLEKRAKWSLIASGICAFCYYVLFVLMRLTADSVFWNAVQILLWCGGFFALSSGLAYLGNRIAIRRIAVDQVFPLELKVPNAQTRSAMAEVDEMVKTRKARFASADAMFAELEEASGQ